MTDRTIRGLLIGLAALVVVAVAFADLTGGTMGTGIAPRSPGGPGMAQGGWWTWGLSLFTFSGVLLIGLALVVRALRMNRRRSSPLDVLKRRYAAGDVTREQYEQMRTALER